VEALYNDDSVQYHQLSTPSTWPTLTFRLTSLQREFPYDIL